MSAPDLSIVIVSYNTRDYLRACLAAIDAQKGDLNVEIVVVDNGSKDGSVAMMRTEFPRVRLIEPGGNTWFTGGNNLGVQYASGVYVLLLNADTLIQPGTLPTLVAYARAHPQVGALTCQQHSFAGEPLRTCSRVPDYLDLLLGYTLLGMILTPWRDRRRARMWYADWARDTTRPVEVIPGSCILARRDLLRRLGPFDDQRLRLYFPEDDFCRRLLDTGAEIHFVAEAVLLHEEHASTRQAQRLASQIYFDDLIAFTRKWHGDAAATLLRALVLPTGAAMDAAQRLRGESDRF